MVSVDHSNSQNDVFYEKIRVTSNQKHYIEKHCKREKISKQCFLQTRIFDTPTRANEHRDMLIRRSPQFYSAVNRIKESNIRNELLAFFDGLIYAMED